MSHKLSKHLPQVPAMFSCLSVWLLVSQEITAFTFAIGTLDSAQNATPSGETQDPLWILG